MRQKLFQLHALEVAPRILGSVLTVEGEDGTVRLRITEVEAYHGLGVPGPYDSGSHSKDRRTERNASMFGPPGHAYVYLNYGMHYALNLVCSPEHIASGVLIRSGEVVEGEDVAHRRRLDKQRRYRRSVPAAQVNIPSAQLATGPGNLATALGISRETHDGLDVLAAPFAFELGSRVLEPATGPRVGVSGEAGSAEFPWRFWIPRDPTVSTYRPGRNVPDRSSSRR